MCQRKGCFDFPGLRAHWVGHPTEIDTEGCDGVYLEGYYFYDLPLWLRYCNSVARPFYLFSVN